jgi:uncharacterized membrane protein
MNAQNLLQTGLLLHMIGLATIAGITLADYMTTRRFRMLYFQDKQKGAALMQATAKLPAVAGLGLLLQIVSGAMMLAATSGAFAQQQWFRIKMVIVILIMAVFIFLNRSLRKRLRMWVLDDVNEGDRTGQISRLANKMGYMQLLLLTFFVFIFVLSTFRFN